MKQTHATEQMAPVTVAPASETLPAVDGRSKSHRHSSILPFRLVYWHGFCKVFSIPLTGKLGQLPPGALVASTVRAPCWPRCLWHAFCGILKTSWARHRSREDNRLCTATVIQSPAMALHPPGYRSIPIRERAHTAKSPRPSHTPPPHPGQSRSPGSPGARPAILADTALPAADPRPRCL